MPKERFHLLCAEETLRLRAAAGNNRWGPEDARAFLLGSVLPDAFFYDLPTFRLAAVGRAAHAGDGALMLRASRIAARGGASATAKALALGVAHHFLTDAFWHPVINRASENGACGHLALSPKAAHFYLESELEGRWTAALGPPDGYTGLLREFRGNECRRLLSLYREMLMEAGIPDVPGLSRMGRVVSLQTRLLAFLSHPETARFMRPALLRRPRTRALGALIAPPGGSACAGFSAAGAPGDSALFARAVLSVTAALDAL